jgi:hypothetical protein
MGWLIVAGLGIFSYWAAIKSASIAGYTIRVAYYQVTSAGALFGALYIVAHITRHT